jgi:hypothetical protein
MKNGLGNCETTFQIEKQVKYNSFLKVSWDNLRRGLDWCLV